MPARLPTYALGGSRRKRIHTRALTYRARSTVAESARDYGAHGRAYTRVQRARVCPPRRTRTLVRIGGPEW